MPQLLLKGSVASELMLTAPEECVWVWQDSEQPPLSALGLCSPGMQALGFLREIGGCQVSCGNDFHCTIQCPDGQKAEPQWVLWTKGFVKGPSRYTGERNRGCWKTRVVSPANLLKPWCRWTVGAHEALQKARPLQLLELGLWRVASRASGGGGCHCTWGSPGLTSVFRACCKARGAENKQSWTLPASLGLTLTYVSTADLLPFNVLSHFRYMGRTALGLEKYKGGSAAVESGRGPTLKLRLKTRYILCDCSRDFAQTLLFFSLSRKCRV